MNLSAIIARLTEIEKLAGENLKVIVELTDEESDDVFHIGVKGIQYEDDRVVISLDDL